MLNLQESKLLRVIFSEQIKKLNEGIESQDEKVTKPFYRRSRSDELELHHDCNGAEPGPNNNTNTMLPLTGHGTNKTRARSSTTVVGDDIPAWVQFETDDDGYAKKKKTRKHSKKRKKK